MKNDRTYINWDNNTKEDNLEDEAITLEHLEIKILFYGTHVIDHLEKIPPQYTTNVDNRRVLDVTNLSSQSPLLHGGHVVDGGSHPSIPQ
jgi:hypothetical protein